MKKLICAVLAALLLLGMLPVGAAAAPPSPVNTKRAGLLKPPQLPPQLQAKQRKLLDRPKLRELEEGEWEEIIELFINTLMRASLAVAAKYPAVVALEFLDGNDFALKDGWTWWQLYNALDRAEQSAEFSGAGQALNAFLENDDAIEKAYRNGTLENKLDNLIIPYFVTLYSAFQKIILDFLSLEALNATLPAVEIEISAYQAELQLTEEQLDELFEKAEAIIDEDISKNYFDLLARGEWAEAEGYAREGLEPIRNLLAEYGVTTEPIAPFEPIQPPPIQKSAWQKAWDFVRQYILFGWLIGLFKK